MKPKRLPRLWCALQGLLPLEVRRSAPAESPAPATPQTRTASSSPKLARRSLVEQGPEERGSRS